MNLLYTLSSTRLAVGVQTLSRVTFWPFLLALALAVRLNGLSATFWYDEVFSAWLSRLPLASLWAATLGDVHPPGYYLLLWLISRAVGHSEALLRVPSVLAGLALIYVIHRLALSLGLSHRAAVLAAVITAFSPFQIYYSQEARMYALLMLAVTAAALGLVERRWWLAVGASWAALYLHNMAVLWVGAVWVAGLGFRGWGLGFRPPGPGTAPLLAIIGSLPALWLTVQQVGNLGGGYWIPPITSPGRVLATLDDLIWFTPNNPFVLATGLLTALGLLFTIYDLRFTIITPAGRFLWLVTALPLAAVVVVSLLWQPVLISRSVAAAAPFFILLLTWAVTRSRRRLMVWGPPAAITAVLIVLGSLGGKMGRPPGDTAMLNLYGEYRPGQAMYHANVGSYLVWKYYRPDMPHYLWPQNTGLQQTLSAQTRQAMGLNEANFEAVKCDAPAGWWLIYFHNPTTAPAEIDYIDHLQQQYPARRVALLRDDVTTEAMLVKIDPKCEE